MSEIVKFNVIAVIILFICIVTEYQYVYADITELTEDYDFDYGQIDKILKDIQGEEAVSFKDIVKMTLSAEFDDFGIDTFGRIIINELKSNYASVAKIVLLGILSALLNAMLPVFNKKQLSDIANMIVMIILISVLAASFYTASSICCQALTDCIDIYKALIPVFLSAVTIVTGSITSGMYYEIILAAITIVTSLFRDGMLVMLKIWFVLVVADSVNAKKRFTKACRLIRWLVKIVCKVVFSVFAGISGIKGMIIPYTEGYKKKVLYKTVKVIPGIGDAAEVVSDTVIGASVAIKNSIGIAGIIILIVINIIPVLKLVILMMIFKVLAASLEPVLDSGFVSVIDSTGDIIGTCIYLLVSGLSLFIIMAGIVCAMTNVT